jgi:hypothetical protein
MKKIYLLLLSLVFQLNIYAQETGQALENFFEVPQEFIHLSLNKTSYIPGEHIWFQGFVVNPKTKFLSSLKQNVNVSIFDEEGNAIANSLHLASGGTFYGDFEIDSIPPGKYQIQAETSFLNQFKDAYIHSQAFHILGETSKNKSPKVQKKQVHWLPESGNLLLDVASNLGVKVTDEKGNGIQFKARLIANESTLASFSSNAFGLAKVRVYPRPNLTYAVEFTTKDETFTQLIPDHLIKERGFLIQHQPINENSRAIRLVSTFHTNFDPNEHSLLLHQDGKYGEIPVHLDENGEYSFVLRNENIFYGVNTLTYIYQGKPVAERLIFNRPKQISSEQIEIGKSFSVNKDSMSIKFTMNDLHKKFTKVNISVLDAENKVNERAKNISSSFYLEPYLGGLVQNPAYYFTDVTYETEQNVDLLLLTQGWSRYSWEEILGFDKANLQPKESGIASHLEVEGGVSNSWNQLIMFAGTYNDEMVFKVSKEDKQVELTNFYPIKNESFSFSLVNKKGKFKSPKDIKLVSSLTPFNVEPRPVDISNFVTYNVPKTQSLLSEDEVTPFDDEDAELLNEVKLKAKNSEEEFFVSHKEDYQFGYNGVRLDIDEEAANLYTFVGDYLAAKGWRVQIVEGSLRNNRGGLVPLVIINNSRQSVAASIVSRRLDEFEYIIFDKTGYGMGVEAQGGVIRLRLRETPIFTNPTVNSLDYITVKAEKGYAFPKEYFTPNYEMLDLQTYKDVAAIAWFPEMFTEDNSFTIQHLHTDTDAYEYYIEGISEDGLMINQKIIVKTKL